MTKAEMLEELRKLGCADLECPYPPQAGQRDNGGCCCFDHIESSRERARATREARLIRELVLALPEGDDGR